MSNKPKLLIVAFNSLKNDPRPYKEWLALHEYFEITELATGPSGNADHFEAVEIVERGHILKKVLWVITLLCGKYSYYLKRYYSRATEKLKLQKFDIVIAHDIRACPMAFTIAGEAPVVIDLHEYLPAQRNESFKWRFFFKRAVINTCRRYLPKAAGLLCPSEGVANKYHDVFGVKCVVNYNAPPFIDLEPGEMASGEVKLVHHGRAAPARCTHLLFPLMDLLGERFCLYMYMVGEGQYFEKIKKMAEEHPKVIWQQPVPMIDIPKEINQYDIGISMLPPSNENHELTIGNKLFEFIQARLAIATWPTKGIDSIISKWNIGFSSAMPDVESLAHGINSLNADQIMTYKHNSHIAAKELTAEESVVKIKDLIRKIVPQAFKC